MESLAIEATVYGPCSEQSHCLKVGYDVHMQGYGLWLLAGGHPAKGRGHVQLEQLLAYIPDWVATEPEFLERFEKLSTLGIVYTAERKWGKDSTPLPFGDRYFQLPYCQASIDRFLDLAPCIRAPDEGEWIKYTPPEYDPRMYYPAITLVSMQPLFPMPSEDHAA